MSTSKKLRLARHQINQIQKESNGITEPEHEDNTNVQTDRKQEQNGTSINKSD